MTAQERRGRAGGRLALVPTSVEDGRQMQARLREEVATMRADLKDAGRRDRMSGVDYLDWERRARRALRTRLDQLTEVNAWLRERPAPSTDEAQDARDRATGQRHAARLQRLSQLVGGDPGLADDPVVLLAGIRNILVTLMAEEVELSEREAAFLGLVTDYLRRHPHPALPA